jgi:hypothetical protein
LHIEGQRDMSRAGPAGGDLLEGFAKGARQILGAIEHGVPLGHRTHQCALIQFGERVVSARAD